MHFFVDNNSMDSVKDEKNSGMSFLSLHGIISLISGEKSGRAAYSSLGTSSTVSIH
jgi:hypothetical protein